MSSFQALWIHLSKKLQAFTNLLDLKMAIKLTLVAILSLYLSYALNAYIKHPDYLVADLWCVITSIIVLQTNIGGTYKAIWYRLIGVIIGSLMGAFFTFKFGAGAISLGTAIFVTILVCSILKIPDSYRLAALSVAVVMLPWKLHPQESPWIFASFRFLDTCFGFIAAILVSHILWPSRALTKLCLNMADRFHLFHQFFDLLFPPPATKNMKQIEKLQDSISQSFIQSQSILDESKLELWLQPSPLRTWVDLLKYQVQIGESLWRIFQVFHPDLEEVFDTSLKQQVHHTMKEVNIALKEAALKLEGTSFSNLNQPQFQNGSTDQPPFNFNTLQNLQDSLTQELIRFRDTHRIRNYPLEMVEDYFVFFYELQQILIKLQKFDDLLETLNLEIAS